VSSPYAVPFQPGWPGQPEASWAWPAGAEPPPPRTSLRGVPSPAERRLDFAAVAAIQQRVARQMAQERPAATWGEDERRERARALIVDEVADWALQQAGLGRDTPGIDVEAEMAQAVFAAMFGLGRLQALVEDGTVENVDTNGCDEVWVERSGGVLEQGPALADGDRELIEQIQRWARDLGQTSREFSTASPLLNLRLPVLSNPLGARLAATMDVAPRPQLSVRLHRITDVTLEDQLARGTISMALLEFLRAAARAGKTIGVTGPMNSGKTVMLRALAAEFPRWLRVATIETEFELGLHLMPHRHARVWPVEVREATADNPQSAIDLAQLIAQSLRHNNRRVILGEVRSHEIVPMLDVIANGSPGSLFTLHAGRGYAAISRMVALATRHGLSRDTANELIAGTVDYLVHLELVEELHEHEDGRVTGRRYRFVDEVLEVTGRSESGGPAIPAVFTPGPDGRAVPGTRPVEENLAELIRAGLDPAWWDSPDGMWDPAAPAPGGMA
jgi:Flp pilus assembly CpaF family ATPase